MTHLNTEHAAPFVSQHSRRGAEGATPATYSRHGVAPDQITRPLDAWGSPEIAEYVQGHAMKITPSQASEHVRAQQRAANSHTIRMALFVIAGLVAIAVIAVFTTPSTATPQPHLAGYEVCPPPC